MQGKFDSVLFGATGMIGSFLLEYLSQDTSGARTLVLNRTLQDYSGKNITQHQLSPSFLKEKTEDLVIKNCYICLGTTMKKAGSKEAFLKIDRDLILECASFAKNHQAQNIFLVSAVGADRESGIFYNQVKGMAEGGIIDLKFAGTHIFRPSLLMGNRKESRLAEGISIQITRLLDPVFGRFLGKYRPIKAQDVAKSMHLISQKDGISGLHFYHFKEIQESINL
jgi:nucleoside-diphosphate-sugar epimerase